MPPETLQQQAPPPAEAATDVESTESGEQRAESQTDLSDASQQAPDPRAAFAAELQRFTARFGVENGTKWFSDNKSYAEALELHCNHLAAQLDQANAKAAELADKVASLDRGETEPVQFNDATKQQPAGSNGKVQGLKPGLARFAAGIKIPTN